MIVRPVPAGERKELTEILDTEGSGQLFGHQGKQPEAQAPPQSHPDFRSPSQSNLPFPDARAF
jgi:hypothetical protein